MESDSGEDPELRPPTSKITSLNSLPDTSRRKYELTYRLFMDWLKEQETTSYSESVLMAYFLKISKHYKASTLWTQHSMLRATLHINDNVDISKYAKLREFLKRQSEGYKPKKSKTFTTGDINKFIKEAPDIDFLLTKVAFILGVTGAMRRHELHEMTTRQFNNLGTAVVVTIPKTKTRVARRFTLTGRLYDIIKRYATLRPTHVKHNNFFINYQKGKCTIQRVGINKFGAMGKQIAKFLNLPEPDLYTGHCFRRSATLDC